MAISDTLPVTFSSWANLPENIEYRIAQFLGVKDLAIFCSLSKHHQQLFDVEGMKFLCQEVFGTDIVNVVGINSMTTAEEIRSAYVKLKDRWISGEELSGAWVDTKAYFEQRNIAGSSKMGLYLKYVWWLDVSANFLAVPAGRYALRATIGRVRSGRNSNTFQFRLICGEDRVIHTSEIQTAELRHRLQNEYNEPRLASPAGAETLLRRVRTFLVRRMLGREDPAESDLEASDDETEAHGLYEEATTEFGPFVVERYAAIVRLQIVSHEGFKANIMFHKFQLLSLSS